MSLKIVIDIDISVNFIRLSALHCGTHCSVRSDLFNILHILTTALISVFCTYNIYMQKNSSVCLCPLTVKRPCLIPTVFPHLHNLDNERADSFRFMLITFLCCLMLLPLLSLSPPLSSFLILLFLSGASLSRFACVRGALCNWVALCESVPS